MSKEPKWQAVEAYDNEPLADAAVQRLKEAGIAAVSESNSPGSAFMGASTPTVVLVPGDKFDQAKELLGD